MDLVFVGPFALSPKSTMRVRALPIARELVRRGHRVTVLLPPWDNPGDSGVCFVDQGVQVINVSLPSGYPALALRLLRQTLALKPDLVHVFKPKAFSGAVAQSLLLRGRTPVVVDTDDWEGDGGWNDRAGYSWWQKRLFAHQERWLLRHAGAVTAASQALVNMASALRHRPVSYLPNGAYPVAQGLASRREEAVVLLYTRFIESPPERVLSVLQAIRKQSPAFTLLLVGAGMHDEDRSFVQSVRAQDIPVEAAGWVEPDRLPGYFARASAAIFPMEDNLINRTKCSAKLVDLLASGVPVIAEAVGECRHYIVDGESGLLVPPDEFDAFGEAVAVVLKNAHLGLRLGSAAHQRMASKYSWERLVDRVETAYQVAIETAKR